MVAAVDPPDNLPTHLAGLEVLAVGGTSQVWRARDRRRGRDVAVKVVEVGTGPGAPDRRARAEREARALVRLAGTPGIATVTAAGTDARGRPWVVCDLIDGPTLAALVAEAPSGPLESRTAASLLRRLAAALAAAHGVGVVHGDVTPANVVLAADGPVLVDFGVGGLDRPCGDRALTPAYAAPERRLGVPPDTAADIYGLGATVWAALCGHPPAAAGDPVPVTVPASLAAVLADCTAADPAHRPTAATLTEMVGPRAAGSGRRTWWGRRRRQ